jgi:hypothetical protein
VAWERSRVGRLGEVVWEGRVWGWLGEVRYGRGGYRVGRLGGIG